MPWARSIARQRAGVQQFQHAGLCARAQRCRSHRRRLRRRGKERHRGAGLHRPRPQAARWPRPRRRACPPSRRTARSGRSPTTPLIVCRPVRSNEPSASTTVRPEHGLPGDPVLHAVQAAGVGGDVAADGGDLDGWPGRGRTSDRVRRRRRRASAVMTPGCTTAISLSGSIRTIAVQPFGGEHQRAVGDAGAAGQSGAGTAGHHGDTGCLGDSAGWPGPPRSVAGRSTASGGPG